MNKNKIKNHREKAITIYEPTDPKDIKRATDVLASINIPKKRQVWSDLVLPRQELEELRPEFEEARRTFLEEDGKDGWQWSAIIYCDTRKILLVNFNKDGQPIGVEIKGLAIHHK